MAYPEANMAAATMCLLLELQIDTLDLDEKFRRLKDLSAYSLTHADILVRREGVELMALGRFFGIGADHTNQARLVGLSEDALAYPGSADTIAQQIAQREDA